MSSVVALISNVSTDIKIHTSPPALQEVNPRSLIIFLIPNAYVDTAPFRPYRVLTTTTNLTCEHQIPAHTGTTLST